MTGFCGTIGSSSIGQHLPGVQEIREDAERAGHARGQFAEPGERREHVGALAVRLSPACCPKRLFARIVHARTAACSAGPIPMRSTGRAPAPSRRKSPAVISLGLCSSGFCGFG